MRYEKGISEQGWGTHGQASQRRFEVAFRLDRATPKPLY